VFEKFANDVYYEYMNPSGVSPIDPLRFDPASALVFWLGGLPERRLQENTATPDPLDFIDPYVPAGFSADPTAPFGDGLPGTAPSLSRTKPFHNFPPERIRIAEPHYQNPFDSASPVVPRYLRFYPERVNDEAAPYVYYKPHRITSTGGTWEYGELAATGFCQYFYAHAIAGQPLGNISVPYRVENLGTVPRWRAHDTYQIIAPGLDKNFGTEAPMGSGGGQRFRTTVSPNAPNFSDEDYDNITSFTSKPTLEKEM
jgi:hypothetical protein